VSEAFEQSKKLIILTILYNLVEGIFALYFGLESNSTSLLSFGLDSFIEITASGIALWGVTSKNETSHTQAEKLIAYSFLLLIVFILTKSSFDLININKPETSFYGVILGVVLYSC
jgi:divalent metal cation (Fe/Co/Zn/Cd) transporter